MRSRTLKLKAITSVKDLCLTRAASLLFAVGLCPGPVLAQDCPEFVGQWSLGPVHAVAVSGDLAYVADYDRRLRIIDISEPSAPIELSYLDMPGRTSNLTVSGHHIYVSNGRIGGLRIIDIRTPSAPVEVGALQTPGAVFGVAVSGDYAYIADLDGGFRVVDISTPSTPVEVGNSSTRSDAVGVAISGDFAFVAVGERGLDILDISTPAMPVKVGRYEIPVYGYVNGLVISGDYAYVAAVEAGLRILDIRRPVIPIEIGSFNVLGWTNTVAIDGKNAYVGVGYGLRVLDVSSPSAPLEIGAFELSLGEEVWNVAISGGQVFVAAGRGGMKILNTCAPQEPFCTPIWIAAAASLPGLGGSAWTTDLGINNRGDGPLVCRFQFLPRGTDNSEIEFTEAFSVEPGTGIKIPDIWRNYTGQEGAGSINVCVSDIETAGIVSRTYSSTAKGTFGQTIVGTYEAIGTHEKVRLGFLSENLSFRTNVGFMNAGETPMAIKVEFFASDGTNLGTDSLTLQPFSSRQWNHAFNRVTGNPIDLGYVDVWTNTEEGHFLTYASVVDNGTGDPTIIWPF